MRNLKIFMSASKAYLTSFLVVFIIFSLICFIYPVDKSIFIYSLILIFFILLCFCLVSFVRLKKVLSKSTFSFFRKDLYEDYIYDLYRKKEKDLNDLTLSTRLKEKDLDKILSIWTHQIKTPISAISLISQRYGDDDIRKELIRIDDYIKSILSFIKLREDSLDYNFKSFSIDSFIKDIVKRYRGFFIEKKLGIDFDIEDEKIISDPMWLGLLIEQILFNSIKYTDKGHISISYRNHILEISDTGRGIKKEDLENIKKFGYAGDTDQRSTSSTGIGLFLVDDIAKKLGYLYKIESKVNEGTKFFINLKRNDLIRD